MSQSNRRPKRSGRGEWHAFDVGSDADFTREVERTGKNKKLMKLLAARKTGDKSGRISLAEAKRQLGIE